MSIGDMIVDASCARAAPSLHNQVDVSVDAVAERAVSDHSASWVMLKVA